MRILKKCKTCNKILGQSAQKAKTGPNSKIRFCRKHFFQSPKFVEKVSKGWFKKGVLSSPTPFKKGNVPWNKGTARKNRPNREKEKDYPKYMEWRKEVLKKDNYTCQNCRGKENIQADHIKEWSLYPELRYEISNGQALCKDCHYKKSSIENSLYWKNQFGSFASY